MPYRNPGLNTVWQSPMWDLNVHFWWGFESKHTWKAWLAKPRPSCLQTTMASIVPQPSPHTVPHTREPLCSIRTSTRPSKGYDLHSDAAAIMKSTVAMLCYDSKNAFQYSVIQSFRHRSYPLLEAHGRNIAPDACIFLMTTAFRIFVHIEWALSDRLLKARTFNFIHMYRAHSWKIHVFT